MSERPHRPGNNSAVVIAKLLDTEGFTDYTANRCEAWWKRNRVKTEGQHRRIDKLERAFSELIAAKMNEAEKLLLGKFIGLKIKQGFETGVAIGLTVAAVQNSKDIDTLPEPKPMSEPEREAAEEIVACLEHDSYPREEIDLTLVRKVCDAYLREHPEDSELPITE